MKNDPDIIPDDSLITVTRSECIFCDKELLTNWHKDNIPYFGEVVHITSICECGFKYSDTLIMTQRKPVRYKFKVKSIDDISVRVVRSTSGTIRIPELGVDIEPGPASESFISNIEGVLDRISNILKNVTLWKDEDEKRNRANELLYVIEEIKEGRYNITVIIEDPLGNSAIISENAEIEELKEEDASNLKFGMIIFEKSETI